MQAFNIANYLKKSTETSGVPLRVRDKPSLSAIAALISRR